MRKLDVHAHCGPWNTIPGTKWDDEALVMLYSALEIEKGIVSSVRALLADLISGNQETQQVVERHEALFGYIYVDPHRPDDSRAQVEALASHPKFIGVKSRDDYHGAAYNGAAYRGLFAALADFRLPALLHTFSVHSMQCALEIAADYGAPVILTHLGGFEWRGAERLHDQGIPGNVYLEPVSSASEPGKYELAVSLVGEDRVVFGTDATLFHPAMAIGAIESSELSEETKRKVYWENAEGVFFAGRGVEESRSRGVGTALTAA
jgi:predicted TIM-barrel fold metal-dependent hydrolase